MKRICPQCNSDIEYKSKRGYTDAVKRNSLCITCRNKSPDKARKVSLANKGKDYNKSNLGRKQTPEWIEKKRQSLKGRKPGFAGKRHTDETRQKMSKIRAEMLLERFGTGHQIAPWYNKDACRLFDEINRELGWNGQHAENGGEFYIDGYWLDYYEPTQNVVIEFDEERHNIPSVKEKDRIKQEHVVNLLKCKFVRIQKGNEHEWKTLLENI